MRTRRTRRLAAAHRRSSLLRAPARPAMTLALPAPASLARVASLLLFALLAIGILFGLA